MTHSSSTSPPPFQWDLWYAGVGGRTIDIEEVNEILRKIHDEQYPRFTGPVAPEKHPFDSPEQAARAVKEKARQIGADIVGICRIEPSDVYSGRTITEEYADRRGATNAVAGVSGRSVQRVGHRVPARVPHAGGNGDCPRRVDQKSGLDLHR